MLAGAKIVSRSQKVLQLLINYAVHTIISTGSSTVAVDSSLSRLTAQAPPFNGVGPAHHQTVLHRRRPDDHREQVGPVWAVPSIPDNVCAALAERLGLPGQMLISHSDNQGAARLGRRPLADVRSGQFR
jgi:hypothetical protein